MVFTSAAIPLVLHARSYNSFYQSRFIRHEKTVLFASFAPVCFAVAALCSPVQAYSIEQASPNDEAFISSVVSSDGDSIEADGASGKDSLDSTKDAGDISPGDVQAPAVGDDEAGASSPVPDVPVEPSGLPSNP